MTCGQIFIFQIFYFCVFKFISNNKKNYYLGKCKYILSDKCFFVALLNFVFWFFSKLQNEILPFYLSTCF